MGTTPVCQCVFGYYRNPQTGKCVKCPKIPVIG
jgi:hypothetical protein